MFLDGARFYPEMDVVAMLEAALDLQDESRDHSPLIAFKHPDPHRTPYKEVRKATKRILKYRPGVAPGAVQGLQIQALVRTALPMPRCHPCTIKLTCIAACISVAILTVTASGSSRMLTVILDHACKTFRNLLAPIVHLVCMVQPSQLSLLACRRTSWRSLTQTI